MSLSVCPLNNPDIVLMVLCLPFARPAVSHETPSSNLLHSSQSHHQPNHNRSMVKTEKRTSRGMCRLSRIQRQLLSWMMLPPWKLKPKIMLASPYLFYHIHLSIKKRAHVWLSLKFSESIKISCCRCFVLITFAFSQPLHNPEKLVRL